MTLTISTRRMPDGTMLVEPHGVINSDSGSLLTDRITAVLAAMKPTTVVVDLDDVPAIDVAGVDALVSGRAAAAARHATLLAVDPSPAVFERLRRCGAVDLVGRRPSAPADESRFVSADRASG